MGGVLSIISFIVWWPRSCISLFPLAINFGIASSLKYLTPFPPITIVCGWLLPSVDMNYCFVICKQNSCGYSWAIHTIRAQASLVTDVRRSFNCLMIAGWMARSIVETTYTLIFERSPSAASEFEPFSESTGWQPPTCSRLCWSLTDFFWLPIY